MSSVFAWLKRTFNPSPSASHAPQPVEEFIPPTVRKPQHAARDARMSVPVSERKAHREMVARLERQRASYAAQPKSIGTSVLKPKAKPEWSGKGKGRAMDLGYGEQSAASASLPQESQSRNQIKDHRTDSASPTTIGPESSNSLRDSTSELHEMWEVDALFRGLDITPATSVSPSGGSDEIESADAKKGGKKP